MTHTLHTLTVSHGLTSGTTIRHQHGRTYRYVGYHIDGHHVGRDEDGERVTLLDEPVWTITEGAA